MRHSLIGDAKGFFKGVRETDEGYLKPTKKNLVDITVTKSKLDYSLDMGNALTRLTATNRLFIERRKPYC